MPSRFVLDSSQSLLRCFQGFVQALHRYRLYWAESLAFAPVVSALTMAVASGDESPLSVTGSIVGIVALIISVSTITQALFLYFSA